MSRDEEVQAAREGSVEAIARDILRVPTLRARNLDRDDFHSVRRVAKRGPALPGISTRGTPGE
jgi:hypothetical protein